MSRKFILIITVSLFITGCTSTPVPILPSRTLTEVLPTLKPTDMPTKTSTPTPELYQTAFLRWSAADKGFTEWTLSGVRINDSGALEFDKASAILETDPYAVGTYDGKNYYTGGKYLVGEAISPVITPMLKYEEAIASWNANTPAGSWLEVQIRAGFGERWSKWYVLGIWDDDNSTVERHSVGGQTDADGTVNVDTFAVMNKKETSDKLQIKLRLFSIDGSAIPTVRNASLAYSPAAPRLQTTFSKGNPALWNTLLTVPECSQMVYPDGGEVWCSPTSTSMVLGYWKKDTGPCEPRVKSAVAGVYDWVYDGDGNWPFNTAYAGAQGYQSYVARFSSLEKAEEFIAAGVPVIISIAWARGRLTGAPIPSSDGHLMVLVGFDGQGNPILNDPAAETDADVQRTYLRSEFEPLWLKASGGTVYLIYPEGFKVPDFR